LFGVAGYSLNYPASTTNPILFPQTPTAGTPTPGFGNIYADVAFLEIAPTIAWQLTDQLAVAAGPTVMSGRLLSTPFAFTAPNDANGDGVFTYPVGSGTHFAWGLGFQVGAYWKGNNGINLGASFKSRQWFQNFKFHGTDELGLPQNFDFHFDYPMIISLGTSYTGIERLLLACDVRYMDWSHTETVGDTARFGADGRLLGLGWDSTWSVSLGAQYELTPVFTVRAGYAFSESPIKNDVAFFNVGSPLILQHAINAGGTMKLSERFAMHFAYYYAPEADVSGPFHTPAGPVAGSNVNYRVTAHAVSIGMTVQF
jgi:long-chain fatty acid transport protein